MTEFRFYTESGIVRFSGRRANSLRRLLEGIKEIVCLQDFSLQG